MDGASPLACWENISQSKFNGLIQESASPAGRRRREGRSTFLGIGGSIIAMG